MLKLYSIIIIIEIEVTNKWEWMETCDQEHCMDGNVCIYTFQKETTPTLQYIHCTAQNSIKQAMCKARDKYDLWA